MEARERLRQYLEQRRELGESEFVLDGLSVEEAMRLLGGARAAAGGGAPRDAAPRPAAGGAESAARKAAGEAAASGDWRETLRSIGAGEKVPPAPPVAPAPATPVAPKLGRYEMPSGTLPQAAEKPGIVVGHAIAGGSSGPYATIESIDALAAKIAACTACGLHATATNPVPGDGSPDAQFVCVGEAPGAKEDETGHPFVGQAGQLLTKILGAINLKREEVFICNVLKHRPPGNRNPAPDEIAACSPYLLRQLELLRPRVILALGTFAAQTLLQTTQPIGKLRGQVHRYYGVPLIVTYHPAALLRNPSWKRPTWEDVQLARRIFDNAVSA